MLLMIDNYDSFTYNLVQYFGELGEDIRVFRNNKITTDQIESLQPSRIVVYRLRDRQPQRGCYAQKEPKREVALVQ